MPVVDSSAGAVVDLAAVMVGAVVVAAAVAADRRRERGFWAYDLLADLIRRQNFKIIENQ
jgi:hypothetical protein